jgi:hypothetical protein
MALEFLLMSPRFNSFLLLRDVQNSKCVWGGVGGHKMHIFTGNVPTFHSRNREIEDRFLLLTSCVSFIDLPFQEHQMMEMHHMDQNPCISSLCPK